VRTAREERFASTTRKTQAAAGLLVVGLQQRLLSSTEAFARSLRVHRATVERQEPGTPEEIAEFCSTSYSVTFPLTEKLDVNGHTRHPSTREIGTSLRCRLRDGSRVAANRGVPV
jgi:hypothetical protein